MDYIFLQHYWWIIISILGALLVFLFFVQGGQGMLFFIGKTKERKQLIVNSLGRKWEFTFTTLVTFGGAFFASFPLFYSTSFGGAFYVWMAILLVMVLQAVSYEFRSKVGNLLGGRTYDIFLTINGLLAPFLVGTAVGTFFTGANFSIDFANIANTEIGTNIISQWESPWRGLEAILSPAIILGHAVMFLSICLGLLYFINNINDVEIEKDSRKKIRIIGMLFLIAFLGWFFVTILGNGYAVVGDEIVIQKYKYLTNFIDLPIVSVLFVVGVLGVLWGLFSGGWTTKRSGIWFAGLGTVLVVFSLFLIAGFNNTPYYPSAFDPESSLTIFNSSSSEFTLRTMFYVSLGIPFVVLYIWFAWRAMNKKQISSDEISGDDHTY